MYRISKSGLGAAMLKAGVDSSKGLAKLAGISVNTVSRFNNGGSVKLPTIQAIARALGVPAESLLENRKEE